MTANIRPKVKIIVVTGPTATGKTRLAVHLASKFEGEIVSADSRQVYRGMDIGTGKDLAEYGDIPFHLINIIEPDEDYNLSRFRKDAPEIILSIHRRNKLPIVTGGSMLYIDSLISEYSMPGKGQDKALREAMKEKSNAEITEILGESEKNSANRNRLLRALEIRKNGIFSAPPLPFTPKWLIIGVLYPRQEVHRRIAARLASRLANGMIEEVAILHAKGISWERLESFGLEYKCIALHLQGKIGKAEMHNSLLAKIRQFARRQDIWFRKMEKKGHNIHWIPEGKFDNASELVEKFLSNQPIPEPKIRLSEILYGEKTS